MRVFVCMYISCLNKYKTYLPVSFLYSSCSAQKKKKHLPFDTLKSQSDFKRFKSKTTKSAHTLTQ